MVKIVPSRLIKVLVILLRRKKKIKTEFSPGKFKRSWSISKRSELQKTKGTCLCPGESNSTWRMFLFLACSLIQYIVPHGTLGISFHPCDSLPFLFNAMATTLLLSVTLAIRTDFQGPAPPPRYYGGVNLHETLLSFANINGFALIKFN